MLKKETVQDVYGFGKREYHQYNDRASICRFWEATVLGDLNAPFELYLYFHKGIGVRSNDIMAKLWWGVAFNLHDKRCHHGHKVIVPKLLGNVIDHLTELIILAYQHTPLHMKINFRQLNENMNEFDNDISRFIGISMMNCLIDKTNDEVLNKVDASYIHGSKTNSLIDTESWDDINIDDCSSTRCLTSVDGMDPVVQTAGQHDNCCFKLSCCMLQ